ncbi:hypothetical protein NQZ68_028927 [Dissostichus eleginoides]|nr:hypothetical protein NQZ68_028927 [Dissostichus eleginoides]
MPRFCPDKSMPGLNPSKKRRAKLIVVSDQNNPYVCEQTRVISARDTSLAGVTPAGPPPPKVGPDWLDLPWGSNRHPQLKS